MSFQPCDHRWVAGELADVALGSTPAGFDRVADRAGPERVTLAEAVALIRRRDGKPPARLITLPARGGTLRAYAAGANLPDASAKIGGLSFREFCRALIPTARRCRKRYVHVGCRRCAQFATYADREKAYVHVGC